LSEVEVSEIESLGGCGDIQWGWGYAAVIYVAAPDAEREFTGRERQKGEYNKIKQNRKKNYYFIEFKFHINI
jgi:hypothetical protein